MASARMLLPVHMTWTERCVYTAQHLCVLYIQYQSHVYLMLMYAFVVYLCESLCNLLPDT